MLLLLRLFYGKIYLTIKYRVIIMKKVLSAILAFILLLSIYPFSVYAEAFTDDSLILYYSFEDGTNATVGDNAEAFNVSFS